MTTKTRIIVGGTFGLMLALKLAGLLDWSWVKVLAPLWLAPVLMVSAVVALHLALMLLGLLWKAWDA